MSLRLSPVENVPHLARERAGRDRLLQICNPRVEHPVLQDRVIRVARHEEHPQLRPPREEARGELTPERSSRHIVSASWASLAIVAGAAAVILSHNHPSGDPAPSKADIAMTREVAAAAKALGIAVHDHLVIGRGGHASFKSLGLL